MDKYKTLMGFNKTAMRSDNGFTVLELLIVVVILGLLSFMVIPEMTEATPDGDSQESELAGQLLTLRTVLDLYRVQHLDQFPCGDPASPVSPAQFSQRMTTKTNGDHSAKGIFGPYLVGFPVNSFNGLDDVRYGSDAGANQAGWCFDPATGSIRPDDGKQGPDGTRHSEM